MNILLVLAIWYTLLLRNVAIEPFYEYLDDTQRSYTMLSLFSMELNHSLTLVKYRKYKDKDPWKANADWPCYI